MNDPRWLDAAGAAAHLSLTESAFLRRVRTGVFPRPTYGAGPATPRWDRLALDAKLDADVYSTDAAQAFRGLADEIAAKGATRRSRKALRREGRGGQGVPLSGEGSSATVTRIRG